MISQLISHLLIPFVIVIINQIKLFYCKLMIINNVLKSDIYRKIKIEYFYFVYRFLGDLCTVVGGCDGNGGRAAAAVAAVVDFVVVDFGGGDDICGC